MGTKTRTRALLVAVGVIAVTAGIVVYVETRPPKAPPPPPPEVDLLEKYKRERLTAHKCDHKNLIELVDYLMDEARWQPALDVMVQAQEDCGEIAGLKLPMLQCHQRLNQWPQAAAILDGMLVENPRDAQLWWQHGETWRYRDQHELAMIDFRQALANAYWNRGPMVVRQFMYAAEGAKAPCEAERAWNHYEYLGGQLDDEARNLIAALDRAKTCHPERGTGRGMLTSGKKLKVKIGTTTAELLLDTRAGTTILSRDLAQRAGLTPTAKDTTATLWSEVRIQGQPARVARMSVGALSTTNVDVVISDALAAGDDGVIGLSFLWHWNVVRSADEVTLSLW
ncbi:MAG: retroviral-like aspartic protease family protein [Kofleriaceae bacterium]